MITLAVIVLIPIIGIAIHQIKLFSTIDTPSKDFGTGVMFDSIASRYDFINRVLAMNMDISWRTTMVQVIKERVPSDNAKLLDVATGTADVALQLIKSIPTATIIGVDPSNGMLDIGREKIASKGLQNQIILQYADARDLSSIGFNNDNDNNEDSSTSSSSNENIFDGGTMAFGIRNVPEPREVALCQIHHLIKSGGIFCILEFSEPNVEEFGVLGYVARFFIRHVVPIIGGMLSGSPKEYLHLQNSIKDFPSPKQFASMMENLSCTQSTTVGADEETSTTSSGRNYFRVDDIVQMNFGSVQLYVTTVMKE